MPPGSRRRTPGLRREEVALLAGVGVTWYTWLEQGREINASTQVLDAVASTLRLDRAEREHMYQLAEATPLLTCGLRGPVPAEVRYLVARMRAAYARHVGDPDWEEDIRRLCGMSREFADLWSRHEVADPEPRVRTFIHATAGPLTFTATELQVPAMPDARLTVYTPADEPTKAGLPLTRRPS